ncbi:putative spindle poison sensitivity protein [Diaporthe ampelina]|uniref:Putative spindle poison sensitivity protein n=1 Tax=Diaporthe ampelina TaxID=1214573 RepID=A0A0G2I4D4_9PEZI|nr:putative spindle poison sensitivity protein [Diaporthe ampelina]
MPSINAIAAGPGPSRGSAGGPGPGGGANGGGGGSQAGFDGPRSPPSAACPFSHDLGASAENVCKYFAKGNCKFGPKCANIHVLPDGRRVNYGKNGVTVTPLNFGSRLNPLAYGHQASNSALTTSFMRAEAAPPYTTYTAATSDDRYGHGLGRQTSLDNGLPTIDTQYSGPASPYGSPHGGEDAIRTGFGLSPIAANKGLSVLDAPLPASFDSNGISHAARYGPWPASVPNKFGLESPTPSLSNAKDSRTSETLKMLHTSAFGSNEHLSPSHLGGDVDAMGSSPPMQPIGEEFYGRRAMHSSSSKYAKPRHLSASVPKVDRDWEDNFLFLEEDYVPGELANDLLTPAEKARRGSVRVIDGGSEQHSGENSASKYGSPVGASSPSRWGPLFQRQKEEDGGQSALGRSLKSVGAFGHVGSPLRNSSLANGIDMIGGLNGNSSRPSLAGSRTASGGTDSLSALTQQIQNTRINDERTTSLSSSPHLHPGSAVNARQPSGIGAHAGAGVIGSSNGKTERDQRALERHISSGSIGSSANGRFTTPIDEEDPSFVFSMEDDDDGQKARKRMSGGFGLGGGGSWSYAAAATGKTSAGNKSSAVETR